MDPMHVVSSVCAALGESENAVDALLRDLFRAYAEAGSRDWDGVQQILSTQPLVEYGKAAALLDALKALASEAGGADDPSTVFEDYDLRGYFAARTQDPAAGEPAATPVAPGSLISLVGEDFYLDGDHQVWPDESEGTVLYHDGRRYFDEMGRPLDEEPTVEEGDWADLVGLADSLVVGHSLDAHEGEFPRDWSSEELRDHVLQVINHPSASCEFEFGNVRKKAFWDDDTQTVVIVDPSNDDGGTFFKPKEGKGYFERICRGDSSAT